MNNFDFEEFESEEDLERAFDDLVASIAEEIHLEETGTAVVNPIRLYQIKFVHAAMNYLTRGTGAKVTCALHKPFRSMGSVSVEANRLDIRDSGWFNKAAALANNMEIYPLTNGKFRLTFTFHGLTKTVS